MINWLKRFFPKAPEVQQELPEVMYPEGFAYTVKHPKILDHAEWSSVVKDDFIRLFCGELIAEGVARKVYEVVGNPKLVVKVETTQETFQNVTEWQLWNELQFTQYGIHLAPCRRISPCGLVLIQERTCELPDVLSLTNVPEWLGDVKEENFGILDGRLVCHDYALHNVIHQFKFAAARKQRQARAANRAGNVVTREPQTSP